MEDTIESKDALEKEIEISEDKYHGFDSLSRADVIEIINHFYNLGLESSLKSYPISDELSRAAEEYAYDPYASEGCQNSDCYWGFITGAKWQKKQEGISESKDLDVAAREYSGKESHPLNGAFKAGATWQKQLDQETIELAEDHAMLAGMEKMRKQLYDGAADCIYYGRNSYGLHIETTAFRGLKLKYQDKVKIIVIKDLTTE